MPKQIHNDVFAPLTITGALTLMIRTKFITEEEALVLYEMIRNQNEYVMAAYELYCYDNKLDELQVSSLSVLCCSAV